MKEFKKKYIYIISLATACILSAKSVYAEDGGWKLPEKPSGLPDNFENTLTNMINWLLGFIGLLSVLMIIYGGVVYVGSSGDQERVASAKKTIKYAVMGLAIAGIAYAIVNLIIDQLK